MQLQSGKREAGLNLGKKKKKPWKISPVLNREQEFQREIPPLRGRVFSVLNAEDLLCGQVMTAKSKHRGAPALPKPLEKQKIRGGGGKSAPGSSCLVTTVSKFIKKNN